MFDTKACMLLLFSANFCLPIAANADVAITRDGDSYNITCSSYDALIAADGCLTNLKVDGAEFLMPRVSYSRGSYFFKIEDQQTSKLTDIKKSGNAVTAKGPDAEIKYTFNDDSMTWTITNKLTNVPIRFYMTINPNAGLARAVDGKFQDVPLVGPIQATEWITGKSKVRIDGSLKVWGPWISAQVWESILDINETRNIEFRFNKSTAEEQRMLQNVRLGNSIDFNGINLASPAECQVFQRESRYKGYAVISGKCDVNCDTIQYRITGQSLKGAVDNKWKKIDFGKQVRGFNQRVQLIPGGWYRLEVRALLRGNVVATANVEKFGIGEVFIGAGQSNSSNFGQFRTKQTSGMVSCYDGRLWQAKDDPFLGTHDLTMEGSYYPAFGDAMYAKYHVPIGIASTGHGGTTVNDWDTHGEIFSHMISRMNQLGHRGFRAVLWHQGESDAYLNTESQVYYNKLCRIIRESNKRAGWYFPWFVANVSYMDPGNASFPRIRDPQKKLWADRVALVGPDTDILTGDNRDYNGKGIHLSPKGLKAAGEMWAEKVGNYLDRILD